MSHPDPIQLRACPIRAVVLALLMLFIGGVAAQEPERHLKGPDLVADVDLLEKAYVALHPGLYRYSTAAQTAQRFDALRETLRPGASLPEAYLAFSRFAATVRCGHTYANFYNQSPALQKALFEQGHGRLPFHFRWLDGRMVVTRNGSEDASLIPGTEVLAVNDVPAHAILEQLLPLARADGANEGKRVAQLEVRGYDKFEAFDVFLPLVFPQFGDRLRLRVTSPGERIAREITVSGLTVQQRTAMRFSQIPEPDAQAWTLEFPRTDVALLRMPSWALYESKWDWRAFLDDVFTRLVKDDIKTLVIDLRGNEGGLSVGDELAAHLVQRPSPRVGYRQLVRYRSVPGELRPYLKTWDASFKDWGDYAQAHDDRYFVLTRWSKPDGTDSIQPRMPTYQGKVYVLIGAANSSATFEFAEQVKASGLATLVGQTTGGNRRGINGGAFFFLTLPNSGVELDVPLVGQFPITAQPDAGIEPDLSVNITPEDVASGRDTELEAVLALKSGPRR